MLSSPSSILNKIQDKLYSFTREDGILDSEDAETVQYKLLTILSLAKKLSFEQYTHVKDLNFEQWRQSILANLKQSKKILSLGEIDFRSQENIRQILKNTRRLVKGLGLLMELLALEKDDDIPEHIYESLEPFVDVDSGEIFESECADIESAILSLLHGCRAEVPRKQAKKIKSEFDLLISRMSQLKLEVDGSLMVELDDGLTAYANPAAGRKTQASHIQSATSFYFEPTHQARTDEISRAAQALYRAKVSGQSTLQPVSSGELIIASAEALRSVLLLGESLEDYEEKLSWGHVAISIRRKPSAKNRGNLIIRNVGRYGYRDERKGGRRDILNDFDAIIEYSGEDKFIDVFMRYGPKPHLITCEMLDLPDNILGKKLLLKVQQNMFLIFCAEISRYFPIEGISACTDSKKMPYAIALGLGIELLEAGHISLQDLFDKDAELGLPTGEKILDSSDRVADKASAILDTYQGLLRESCHGADSFLALYPQGHLVQAKEAYVTLLASTFGDNLSATKKRMVPM